MANDLIGSYKPGMIELANEVKPDNSKPALSSPLPPREKERMVAEEIPDSEIERIRQQKTQDFEEAVNAKTSIQVNNTHLTHQEKKNVTVNNVGPSLDVDMAASFKQQLQLIQGRQRQIETETLGGNENTMRWQLHSKLENPNSHFELRAGGVIPGVMLSGISSELPGQIIAQISQNVYDTATGRYLLIPQGTKLIGVYSSEISFGQNGVLVAWQRLIFPDSKVLDIGSMPGTDSAGFAGFRDQVDHHYARIYGSALLMSGIVAGISYSQATNQANQTGYTQPTAGSVLSQALGQQLGEVTAQLMSKNLNVAPTIHIRPGYRFNVIVTKDLIFQQPYRQFVY